MTTEMTRRALLASAALGVAGTVSAQDAATKDEDKILVVGVSCSPRKSMTTATAMSAALEAAKGVDPRITTELIDLGGMKILGSDGNSSSGGASGVEDDFNAIVPLLQSPNLGGMMIGSPSYFRSMSSLCKAFLERLAVLREPKLLLADMPVGALSVGSYRNGGQELVIEQILTVMLCHEAMLVGGKPKAHQGATLWNAYKDDITQDEFGMESAKNLGIRVAEAALKHKG
ncbi:MAG: NADPH-dependent FMN reductase [Candidatus Hydrogenedentes bacterium ADurb.Bin179]|nr:MAG: NADPH-dependent FMN reductase [Candidatus Hydrogenedentes bacterium ADurb.Bin179]